MASPDKYQRIIRDLRRWIVGGVYQPGERLPTSRQLTQLFNGSSATIQRAMKQLADDGFVRPCGCHGTFVAEHPPHISQFGLVFPHRADAWQCRFASALELAIERHDDEHRRIVVFYRDGRNGNLSANGQSLDDFLAADRLAGYVEVCPESGQGHDGMCRERPPYLSVSTGDGSTPCAPLVGLDYRRFLREALGKLAARGSCRPAIVAPFSMMSRVGEWLWSADAGSPLPVPQFCLQGGSVTCPPAICNLVQALVKIDGNERPDGLVLMAEQFMAPALAGLAAGDAEPGEQLPVLVQEYRPRRKPLPPGVIAHGWDLGQVLTEALAGIETLRRGEPVPETLNVPPHE